MWNGFLHEFISRINITWNTNMTTLTTPSAFICSLDKRFSDVGSSVASRISTGLCNDATWDYSIFSLGGKKKKSVRASFPCAPPSLHLCETGIRGVMTFRSNVIVETIMTCVNISLIFTVNNTFQKLPHVYLIENIMWYVLYHLCIHQLSNKWATEVWK